MVGGCPGAERFQKPYPEMIRCVFCDEELEIWSDELKVTCSKCAREVARPGVQCCLDWCEHARECVGPERYERYMKGASGAPKKSGA